MIFRKRSRLYDKPGTSEFDDAMRLRRRKIDASMEPTPPGTTVAPSVLAAARQTLEDGRSFAPHCDQRILHEHGECWACDLYPDWQALRVKWGIAFTGHQPEEERLGPVAEIVAVRRQLPCPADFNRPPGSASDHQNWPNNRAEKERG